MLLELSDKDIALLAVDAVILTGLNPTAGAPESK
jgi:hypothetical protein